MLSLLIASQGWLVGHGPLSRPAATAASTGRRTAELQMDESAVRPEAYVGSSFGSGAMAFRQGTLVLEDGSRLRGVSFGFEESTAGAQSFQLLEPGRNQRRGLRSSLSRAAPPRQVSSSSRRAWWAIPSHSRIRRTGARS